MKQEETVDYYLRWAWLKIARAYSTEAIKQGSTMSVGYVLLSIDNRRGTPSTHLGPKMGMEPRSLTRTLKCMEENGLIYREADIEDKRVVRIFLTDKGKASRKVSKKAVVGLNTYIQNKIGEQDLAHFFQVMKQLNEVLEGDIFQKVKGI